jgi:flagellar hook-basal body complex protein FliE
MTDIRIAPVSLPASIRPPSVAPAVRGTEGFGDTLTKAVAAVNDMQQQASDATVALASGQPIDSAQAIVTIEKANVSFQFAVQIRNKLLEAYQEIMRMTV